MDLIRYKNIIIESNFEIKKLEKLEIYQKVNEHSLCFFRAILVDSNKYNEIHNCNLNTNIKIKNILNNSEEMILFNGLPMDATIKYILGIHYIEMNLISYSYKLDIKKKSRSFQNIRCFYSDIFSQIIDDEHRGQAFDLTSKGVRINRPIIQYEETDWEFIKRLSSQLNVVLIPNIIENKPQIYIGIPNGDTFSIETRNYKIIKEIDTYLENRLSNFEQKELDFTYFEIESFENYKLGDKVIMGDIKFVVIKKDSCICNGLLKNKYKFQLERGVSQKVLYNKKFAGLSLDGKVIDVKESKVKIHLDIDERQDENTAYWYKLNTQYTTTGSTGFYIMPEIGNKIKLFVPNKNETFAYVRNIDRDDGDVNQNTKDTSIKYFQTIHKKKMKFSKNNLDISEIENKLHIKFNIKNGIEIKSDNDINIKSDSDIYISGAKVNIRARDEIKFTSKNSNMCINEKIDFKAVEKVRLF